MTTVCHHPIGTEACILKWGHGHEGHVSEATIAELEAQLTAALAERDAARQDAERLAEAVTEWNRAKAERENWAASGKQVIGAPPPMHLLGNAKKANEMLSDALAAHESLTPGLGEQTA